MPTRFEAHGCVAFWLRPFDLCGTYGAFNAWETSAAAGNKAGDLAWHFSAERTEKPFVSVPGDTIDIQQPNIPRWRASAIRPTVGRPHGPRALQRQPVPYAGQQRREQLHLHRGRFVVVDVSAQQQMTKTPALASGVDNLNNDKYWNSHPYPSASKVPN